MTVDENRTTPSRQSQPWRTLVAAMTTGLTCVVTAGCENTLEATKRGVCGNLAACAVDEARAPSQVEDLRDSCYANLDDALKDRRMRQEELVACDDCLQKNQGEACGDLLERRDCDVACEAVSFVLQTRTSSEKKNNLCHELARACVLSEPNGCYTDLSKAVVDSFEGDGLLDARLEGCVDCVVAGRATAAELQCSALVDSCKQPCEAIGTIRASITLADAALELCAATIERCPLPDAADGGLSHVGSVPCSTFSLPDSERACLDRIAESSRNHGLNVPVCSTCALRKHRDWLAFETSCGTACANLFVSKEWVESCKRVNAMFSFNENECLSLFAVGWQLDEASRADLTMSSASLSSTGTANVAASNTSEASSGDASGLDASVSDAGPVANAVEKCTTCVLGSASNVTSFCEQCEAPCTPLGFPTTEWCVDTSTNSSAP